MSQKTYSRGLELLTEPRTLFTFLFGGVALGVMGSAVYQLLTNWLTTSNFAAIRIAAGAFLALIAAMWFLNQLAHRLRPVPPLPNKRPPARRRGIIFLVSKEPTIHKAIAWHSETLERCWLICSEKSMPLGVRLKAELQQKGKDAELVLINDVLDAVECRNTVDEIYARLRPDMTESDVILDFTGMTTIASVGAVLACLDEQRPIQYTPAVYDDELKAYQARDPVEIVLTWDMLKVPQNVKTKLAEEIIAAGH